ncbi:hypothetical protein [Chamaesiphon polymorphus]|uniref:Bacteriocin n=1 Tax=Chamaesiphon polymorphus CCALA 037 TaxID=2107692 RepID=A0A2T1GLY2_9CYAN|nr:hypothetical protein [Chamaesiphon polymorphus]PSB58891.1 hypothetical protein C7B77_02960 [Chamaesiphon polymorphus CCALA 037]
MEKSIIKIEDLQIPNVELFDELNDEASQSVCGSGFGSIGSLFGNGIGGAALSPYSGSGGSFFGSIGSLFGNGIGGAAINSYYSSYR